MQLNVKEIAEGKHDGKKVWICDYRFNNLDEKPIRHVPPTEVLIRANSEIKDRVYYSESHFALLNKAGVPGAKITKLYDNTGYRSYPGTPLDVYDNETECKARYEELRTVILAELDSWYANKTLFYTSLKTDLTKPV